MTSPQSFVSALSRRLSVLLVPLLVWAAAAEAGAADGDLDTSFDPGAGADGAILETALQNDGKIVVAGGFLNYAGVLRVRVARVNPDGSLDTTFNPGSGASGGTVEALALQPDGKILIGGVFTSYNGVARNKVARVNANGSLDTTFDPGSGPAGSVFAIAVQADGKILLGGSFQSVNGVTRPGIARLNANGSVDTTFDPGSGVGLDFRQVLAIAVQADGRILIGGNFSSYNGVARLAVARINADGSLDTSFDPGSGAEGGNAAGDGVRAVALQGDSIVIGGYFKSYNGVVRAGLARLNANGSLDMAFNSGAPTDAANDNVILAISPLADGKLIIGGPFTSYNGAVRKGVARVNADGSADISFDSSTGTGGSSVSSILVQGDGKIVIGGSFTTYNGVARNRIARLVSTAAEPPAELDLWVAGRDLVANEKPDAPKETAATNATVPQWSYGYRATVAGTDFALFAPSSHTNADRDRDAVEGWVGDQGVVLVNTGTEPVQYFAGNIPFKPFFRDQILVARTSTVFMPVVRWTAPSAGSYRIIAKWVDLNPNNRGGAAHVVINGQQVFGRQPDGAFVGQEWPDEGNAAMPAETFALQAGATVDFVLSTRDGDSSTDDTAFSAAIARVPTVTITAPASAPSGPGEPATVTVVEGQDVNVSVSVASKLPITAVRLLIDGQPAPSAPDLQAPYEFALPKLEGTHYLTAIAQDSTGAQGVSEQIRLQVDKTGAAAARASGQKGTERAALAASGGATFRCTQSGLWHDASTWGGQGVPGQHDDAIIPRGLEVDLAETRVDIANLEVAGRLVAATGGFRTPLFISGTMQMSGYVRGPAILIQAGGKFVSVGARVRFENTHLFNYGETIVGEKGGISGDSGSELSTFGTVNILRAQGTNRPTTALFNGIRIAGGQVLIGPFARLVAAGGGNLIGQDGGSLVGHDGSSLIGQDGSTLIGQDGSTLIGQDGSSLIGADGGRLIGLDGSTLIGLDGSTLIGQDGGSLIGQDGGSFQTAAAAVTDGKGSERVSREISGGLGGIIFRGGTLRGILNLIANVTNSGAFLSPGNSPGRMRVFGDYTQESGGTLLLEVSGTQTEPLQFDQLEIGGTASLGGKLIVNAIDGFNPQPGDVFAPLTYSSVSGSFDSVSSNAQIAFGAEGMTMQVSGPNPPAPKALNIATRMRVETGDNALIAGFIITGSQPKKVLVRGIGPSLPVTGALADPVLSLDNGAIVNDDWKSTQEQEIRDTTIPPASDLESAIVATLSPGPHTAILRGKSDGTGVGLVEVYDLEGATPVQLANISTRGLVQAGDNVMIGGFIIGGDYPAKVLLRAIGPSLSVTGKLEDPTLELVDANGAVITNDNWRATQEAEIIATTVPPTNDKEAAIVATLVPGFYTAIVRGKDNTAGVALVEAYNLQ